MPAALPKRSQTRQSDSAGGTMPNHFGNKPTVASFGRALAAASGGMVLRRRLGQRASSLQFLNTLSGLTRATALFITHAAYLVARSLSRHLRPVGDASQWKVVVTSDHGQQVQRSPRPCQGITDDSGAQMVGQYLNNYNVVLACNAARERADDMDGCIDASYLGR